MEKESIKNRIKNWFKDPYNLVFFLILLALIGVRLYYFNLTSSQPLWWDEADYMNMARTYLGADYWNLQHDAVRPILLPAIAAFLMIFGLGEISVRFLVLLSSIISIILLYNIGKLFFNKKVALVSSLLLGIFWSFSFYSFRILTDVPLTMLWLAVIYFFFSAYLKDKNWKSFIFPGILLGLSFLMKSVSVMLVLFISIYLLTTEKSRIFKNNKIIIFYLSSFVAILPLFIYQYLVYKNPLQFFAAASLSNPENVSMYKSTIDIIAYIIKITYPMIMILFALGLLYMFYNIILYNKKILEKQSKINKYYLIILWLGFSFAFFMKLGLMTEMYIDERYFFIFYPAIFLICGIGIDCLYKIVISQFGKEKIIKIIFTTIIIFILLFTAYKYNLQASQVIDSRIDSFIQLKLAGEYVKENTAPGDMIFILEEQAEITYYSERNFVNIGTENSTSIINTLEQHKPKYLVMSFYYSMGNEFSYDIINYVFSNHDLFIPVQTYPPYVDQQQTIPLVVVYKINPIFFKI